MSDREDAAPAAAEQDKPRSKSRSPLRKSKKSSGFKWKQKPSSSTAEDSDRRDYRDGPGRRSRYDDEPRGASSRSSYREDDRRDRDRDRDYRHPDRRDDRDSYRRNRSRSRSPRRDRDRDRARDRSRDRDARPKKEKKDKTPAAPAPAPAAAADGEEMIVVHVNDRLGTKAAIPCFASDDIKSFKVMVAARIGREPHEILLKRQGERPFKDHITLGDYGVNNGVQLDLEVDTGD